MSVDFEQQAETLVQERLAQAEQEKQQAIAEAVRVNQEAADSHLSEQIANKDKELAELRSGEGQTVDIEARIAEAVQAREAELKELHEQEVKAAADAAYRRFKQPSTEKIIAAGVKHGEKLFNERWEKFQEEQAAAGNSVPQEIITKAVEEANKKKDEEYAEKLQKATDGAKNEAEMRNKLQLGKLQKQVLDAKAKLDLYEKQFGQLPGAAQATPQQQRTPQTPQQQQRQSPMPQLPPQQEATSQLGPGGQPVQGTNVLQKLQTGRGAGMQPGRGQGIPRLGRGGNVQQGVGRGGGQGQGQGRGQRLSGQHPQQQQQQQQTQNQGQRPAVNRPVPSAGSPTTTGPGQQRRQSAQQQQSQLPRPATGGGLNVGAAPFQPGGVKRPRDDESQGGQGTQTAGQKRTRVANSAENTGGDGQA